MDVFTQIVFVVARVTPQSIQALGTGFLVSSNGLVVTTKHVIGNSDNNLCILFPKVNKLSVYQDTADLSAQPIPAKVTEVDPIRDLAVLQTSLQFSGQLPLIEGFDSVDVGTLLAIFGYPHVTDGRVVLTYQQATLGAKVLLESQKIKVKHGIINNQARPGQSGSLVINTKTGGIAGVLVGAYAPTAGGRIMVMNIDPQELHQTTHCVSAEYINGML